MSFPEYWKLVIPMYNFMIVIMMFAYMDEAISQLVVIIIMCMDAEQEYMVYDRIDPERKIDKRYSINWLMDHLLFLIWVSFTSGWGFFFPSIFSHFLFRIVDLGHI